MPNLSFEESKNQFVSLAKVGLTTGFSQDTFDQFTATNADELIELIGKSVTSIALKETDPKTSGELESAYYNHLEAFYERLVQAHRPVWAAAKAARAAEEIRAIETAKNAYILRTQNAENGATDPLLRSSRSDWDCCRLM